MKFLNTMLKSVLYGCSDAYILVTWMITIADNGADGAANKSDERDKKVTFKSCTPFINCISKINNSQAGNAKDQDVMMLMYNLMEYSDDYSKRSGILWQYYRDEPHDTITDSESFKLKVRITEKNAYCW